MTRLAQLIGVLSFVLAVAGCHRTPPGSPVQAARTEVQAPGSALESGPPATPSLNWTG